MISTMSFQFYKPDTCSNEHRINGENPEIEQMATLCFLLVLQRQAQNNDGPVIGKKLPKKVFGENLEN